MKRIIDNIYLYKTEMMGVAILILMIFHTSIPNFGGLKNLLEIGVDIFLFLGGFTCAISYDKCGSNNFMLYFKKRIWRILPPYLMLYCIIYAIEFLLKDNCNWSKFIGELTMWDNIVHNSINMWYVPAVLIMYFLLPLYIMAHQRWEKILWLPILIILFLSILTIFQNLEILPFQMVWIRLPIFLLGVNFFLIKDFNLRLNHSLIIITSLIAFILYLLFDYWHLEVFKRFCYIPMVIAFVYFYNLNRCFKEFFKWAGVSSYENYLSHWYIVKILYDYTAVYVVSYITSFPSLNYLCNYRLGIEILYVSVLSIPLALLFASSYHKLLNSFFYK